MTALRARAPGKLVLFGDYAVLEGAPALATAVPVFAEASFEAAGAPDAPFVIEASNLGARWQGPLDSDEAQVAALSAAPPALNLLVRAACAAMELSARRLPAGTLRVDTSAFHARGRKVGLGSSAAVLVAAMQALMRAPPVSVLARERALDLPTLMALHRAWQRGTGSGIDVAASLLGGVVRFQLHERPGSQGAPPEVAVPLSAADGPPWVAVGVGVEADTRMALAAFAELKRSDAKAYWRHLEALAQVSHAAVEFWSLRQHVALLPLVRRACEALEALGEAMGQPVVTAPHRELAARAARAGGAYKPSGAGGGDVGVAFFVSPRARAAFVRGLRHTPFFALGERSAPTGAKNVQPKAAGGG